MSLPRLVGRLVIVTIKRPVLIEFLLQMACSSRLILNLFRIIAAVVLQVKSAAWILLPEAPALHNLALLKCLVHCLTVQHSFHWTLLKK